MISFSRGLSPTHAKAYYTRELGAPENQLPLGLESGTVEHHGAVAVHLGLIAPSSHTPETFRNLCEGRSPDGTEILVAPRKGWSTSEKRAAEKANARNAGWDINCSPEKSVSIAALVLGDHRIVEAHREAVDDVVAALESSICTRKPGGTSADPTGALLATTFHHGVSRALDPQLHTHIFVHNITVDRSGKTRAVYIAPSFRQHPALQAAYNDALAPRLEALGYRVSRNPKTGAPRIDGLPLLLEQHFSTRSTQARRQEAKIRQELAAGDRKRHPTAKAVHRWAAQASRPDKPGSISWSELQELWLGQMRELGFDPERLRSDLLAPQPQREPVVPAPVPGAAAPESMADPSKTPPPEPFESAFAATDLARTKLEAAIRHFSERSTVFTDRELVEWVRTMSGEAVSTAQARAAILESPTLLVHGPGRYTTAELIAKEQRLADLTQELLRAQRSVAPPDVLASPEATTQLLDNLRALRAKRNAPPPPLSEEQRAAVHTLLTDPHAVLYLQGLPGAGKSLGLTSFKTLAEHYGAHVRFFAPTTNAVRALRDYGLEAETIQRFNLTRVRPTPGRHAVWVIDEIGQTGLDDFTTILTRARAVGAKVIAVGDPEQHRSIPAGNVAHTLEEIGVPTVRLTELRRQIPDPYRAIADAIVRGKDPDRALTLLASWDPDTAHTARARTLATAIAKHYLVQADQQGKLTTPLSEANLGTLLARKERQLDLSSRLVVANDVNTRLQALAALYLSYPEDERNGVLTIIHTHDLRERFANIVRQVRTEILGELRPTDQSVTLGRFQRLGWTDQQAHEIQAYLKKPKGLWVQFEDAPAGIAGIQKGDRAEVLRSNATEETLTLRLENTGALHELPVSALPGVEVLRRSRLELHVGDRVQFREPNRSEGIANGMLATFTGHLAAPTDPTRQLASFRLDDGGRTVYLDAGATHVIDYGYSVTSFSAQGATRPHVLVHIDTTAHGALIHSHQATVDFTRGAQSLTLVTDNRQRLAAALATNLSTRFAADALRHPAASHLYRDRTEVATPLPTALRSALERHAAEWVTLQEPGIAISERVRAALADATPTRESLRAALHEAFTASDAPWPHDLGTVLLRADLHAAGVHPAVAAPLASLAQHAATELNDPILQEVAAVWNHQIRSGNLRGILAGADDLAYAALTYQGNGEIGADALRAAQRYRAALSSDLTRQPSHEAAPLVAPHFTPVAERQGALPPPSHSTSEAVSRFTPAAALAPTSETAQHPRPQPLPDPEPAILRSTAATASPAMSAPDPTPSDRSEQISLPPAPASSVSEQHRAALRAAIVTDIFERRGEETALERRLKSARRVLPSATHAGAPTPAQESRREAFRLQLKAAISAELIANHRGIVVGQEINFACPNRDGHKHGDRNPSASWNEERGAWFCHGGSCKAKGGYQDLAKLVGVRIEQPGATTPSPETARSRPAAQQPVRPSPELVREGQPWSPSREPDSTPIHPEFGVPDHVFEVRDRDHNLFCLQLRWDAGSYDERKHFAWWREGQFSLSRFGLTPADAPLCGSERLADLPPGSRVVVTEGAKAATALRDAGIPAVATISGANALPGRNALRALAGFEIVLWADHDLNGAGEAHMRGVGEALASLDISARLYVPTVPREPEYDGFDAADWIQDLRSEGMDDRDLQSGFERLVESATPPALLARHPDPRLQALLDHAGEPVRFDQLAQALTREADASSQEPSSHAVRVVVSGGRDHVPSDAERDNVIATLRALRATHVVTGGDRGVDRWAENLGRALGLEVERHLPDWDSNGRRAGYLRNLQMLRTAQAAVLLPGAAKEDHLRRTAKEHQVPTWDFSDPATRPPNLVPDAEPVLRLSEGLLRALAPFGTQHEHEPSTPAPTPQPQLEPPTPSPAPERDLDHPTLVLTRNPDFVAALRAWGWIGTNTQIRASVDHPDQVAGLRVVGNLPLPLAVHAHSVVDVSLPAGTPRDHRGLTETDLATSLNTHTNYTVRELDALPAPPARTIVLSDQPEMLALARELGLAGANTDLQVELRGGEDLSGVRVVGEPALAQAARAREVVLLPLHREPEEIGKALPLERLRDIAGAPRAFEIRVAGHERESSSTPAPETAPTPSEPPRASEPTGSAARTVADSAAPGAAAPAGLSAEPLAVAAAESRPDLHPVEPAPLTVPVASAAPQRSGEKPSQAAEAAAPTPPRLERPPIEKVGQLRFQDLRGVVEGRRYLIVGDVHGCLDELKLGLERLSFDPQRDVLISVGDLADRGPKVRETIEYFRSLPHAYAVQGNHEQLLAEWVEDAKALHSGIEATLRSYDWEIPAEVGAWMSDLPHIVRLPDALVVHAGLNPALPIASQRPDDILWMRDLPRHPATPEAQRQELHDALGRLRTAQTGGELAPSTGQGAGYAAGLRSAAQAIDEHFESGAPPAALLARLASRRDNLAIGSAELRATGLAALERDAAHLDGQRLAHSDVAAAAQFLLAERGAAWHTAWPAEAPRLFVGHTPQPDEVYLSRADGSPQSARVVNLDGGAVFGRELRFFDSADGNVYSLATPVHERSSISPSPNNPEPKALAEGAIALSAPVERSLTDDPTREVHALGERPAASGAALRSELERPAYRAIARHGDAAEPARRDGPAGLRADATARGDSRDQHEGPGEDAPELLRVAADGSGARVASDRGVASDRPAGDGGQGDERRGSGDARRDSEPLAADLPPDARGAEPLDAPLGHDGVRTRLAPGGDERDLRGRGDRGADGSDGLGGAASGAPQLIDPAGLRDEVAAARARLDRDDELLRRYGRTPEALRKLAQDRHAERSAAGEPAGTLQEAIDRTLVEQLKYRPVIDADALLLGTYASLESPPTLETVANAIDRDPRLLWSPDRTRATLPELVAEQHRVATYWTREPVEPMAPGATAETVARDQQLPDAERRAAAFSARVLASPERIQIAATLGNSVAPNDAYRVLERAARAQGYDVLHVLPDRANPRLLEDFGHPDVSRVSRYITSGVAERAREPLLVVVHGAERIEGESLRRLLDRAEVAGHRLLLRTAEPGISPAAHRNPLYLAEALGKPRLDEPGPTRVGLLADWWRLPEDQRTVERLSTALDGRLVVDPSAQGRLREMTSRAIGQGDRIPFAVFATPDRAALYSAAARKALSEAGELDLGQQRAVANWRELRGQEPRPGDLLVEAPRGHATWAQYLVTEVDPETGHVRATETGGRSVTFTDRATIAGLRHFRNEPLEVAPGEAVRWTNPRSLETATGRIEPAPDADGRLQIRSASGELEPLPAWNLHRNYAAPAYDRAAVGANEHRTLIVEVTPDRAAHPIRTLLASHDPARLTLVVDGPEAVQRLDRPGVEPAALPLEVAREHLATATGSDPGPERSWQTGQVGAPRLRTEPLGSPLEPDQRILDALATAGVPAETRGRLAQELSRHQEERQQVRDVVEEVVRERPRSSEASREVALGSWNAPETGRPVRAYLQPDGSLRLRDVRPDGMEVDLAKVPRWQLHRSAEAPALTVPALTPGGSLTLPAAVLQESRGPQPRRDGGAERPAPGTGRLIAVAAREAAYVAPAMALGDDAEGLRPITNSGAAITRVAVEAAERLVQSPFLSRLREAAEASRPSQMQRALEQAEQNPLQAVQGAAAPLRAAVGGGLRAASVALPQVAPALTAAQVAKATAEQIVRAATRGPVAPAPGPEPDRGR